MPVERAGVLIVSKGCLALIERLLDGRRYWVIPGGGVESGETIAEAARREAAEELGVAVELGELRVRIDHREADGSIQRQWYFDASASSDDIRVVGPELANVGKGTYTAVWVDLDKLDTEAVLPAAVARLVVSNHGQWSGDLIEIDER